MRLGMRQGIRQRQDERQMETADQESHHPRIRQEGHGMGQESQKSRLQQNLQENDIQPLGSLQIGSPSPA